MVDNVVVSLPTLPIDLFYRILDHLDLFTILCSMQNVCTRINAVLTSYSPYQVSLISMLHEIILEKNQFFSVIYYIKF